MARLVKIIGIVTWMGMGLLMFLFWVGAMYRWLGGLGLVIAVLGGPLGAITFPFVYWWVEDVFPTIYFVWWGIGIVGMVAYGIGSEME